MPAMIPADPSPRTAPRVILLVEPPYDPSQIRAAARLLSG